MRAVFIHIEGILKRTPIIFFIFLSIGSISSAPLWAIDINPLRMTLELGEKFNPYKQFKIPTPNIEVLRSAEMIGIPIEFKNNQPYTI